MALVAGVNPTKEDIEWASNFAALNALFNACGTNSERATLLLSTCRNAYLTINALFVDLQVLMGDARDLSDLRSGSELMLRGKDAAQTREHFGRARQIVHEFESKREVWENRYDIWRVIQEAKQKLEPVDGLLSSRIDLVLRTPRIPDQSFVDGWDYEVLAVDLEPRDHLEPSFKALDDVFAILKAATELGLLISELLVLNPQAELNFSGRKLTDDTNAALAEVPNKAKALAESCGWETRYSDDALVIQLSRSYDRPQSLSSLETIRFQSPQAIEGLASTSLQWGSVIREALYVAHSRMRESFKPNVAKLPMPAPFVISLRPQNPLRATGQPAPLTFNRIRCTTITTPKDTVRIAIAGLAVPEKQFDLQHYCIPKSISDSVKHDVRRAIVDAKDKGCDAVVFPEYSVPSSMDNELMELANKHSIVIVAGLDGQMLDEKLVDQAIVAIPGEKRAHYQRKQEPSQEEEVGAAFFRDGQFRFFGNSPIGDFAVVLCSDLLQLNTLQIWNTERSLPDLLFVLARNKYTQLYQDFAKSDSVRLYAAVIICNVCDSDDTATSEGSCAVVPRREGGQILQSDRINIGGKFLSAIDVVEISLRAIRARSRGKPEQGYFAVPASARRA